MQFKIFYWNSTQTLWSDGGQETKKAAPHSDQQGETEYRVSVKTQLYTEATETRRLNQTDTHWLTHFWFWVFIQHRELCLRENVFTWRPKWLRILVQHTPVILERELGTADYVDLWGETLVKICEFTLYMCVGGSSACPSIWREVWLMKDRQQHFRPVIWEGKVWRVAELVLATTLHSQSHCWRVMQVGLLS
jgi:hypothetical protein